MIDAPTIGGDAREGGPAARSTEAGGRIRVWDLPLRLFHWSLMIAIALAFLSSEEDSALGNWHILAGWIAGILIVFRLVWGLVGGEHSRFSNFVRPSRIAGHVSDLLRRRGVADLGHNPLGAVSVVILLALSAAVVWTGAFGAGEDLHEFIAWTLLGMVALHIAAVVLMSLLQRENLVRAMITGNKAASRHPSAVDARRPTVFALGLAALVVAGTAYAILRYDPQAFTLRSAESFEHAAGGQAADAAARSADEERD